jgi:hypothetical protein
MASLAAVARVQDDRLLALLRKELSGEEQQMFVTSFSQFLQCNPRKDFKINLDDVYEWVGFTRKDNAKRAVCKYLPETQYQVLLLPAEEQTDDGRGGRNRETVMLTVNGFKQLCMCANTDKGRRVREYYINMESIMLEYVRQVAEEKDRLLEDNARALQESARALEAKDEELEAKDAELEARDEELERFRTKVYEAVDRLDKVYVCKDAAHLNTDKHKIGKAIDDTKREATLNTALADGAKMVYVLEVSNGKLVEDIAKHALKRYHHAREHYNCKLDHTCDVYDIGGTVVDTLASSYEFITRDDLFDKVTERLEECRLRSFACKGGFEREPSGARSDTAPPPASTPKEQLTESDYLQRFLSASAEEYAGHRVAFKVGSHVLYRTFEALYRDYMLACHSGVSTRLDPTILHRMGCVVRRVHICKICHNVCRAKTCGDHYDDRQRDHLLVVMNLEAVAPPPTPPTFRVW